ncbi:hypothetical protein FRB98_005318, partial [Tulasnella sp. 332]
QDKALMLSHRKVSGSLVFSLAIVVMAGPPQARQPKAFTLKSSRLTTLENPKLST